MPDRDGEGSSIEEVRVRKLPDGRMDRTNAARYLGLAAKTLAMWKLQGKGPPTKKVGGRVFYFKNDLDDFIARGDN
jgi:hypothetical protein